VGDLDIGLHFSYIHKQAKKLFFATAYTFNNSSGITNSCWISNFNKAQITEWSEGE